jgi:hypothetical protein
MDDKLDPPAGVVRLIKPPAGYAFAFALCCPEGPHSEETIYWLLLPEVAGDL